MKETRNIAIIQARMASSRLPGKILHDLAGQPVLLWMIHRVQRATLIDDIMIATTNDPSDDEVAVFCQEHSVSCYRGSMHDVLDRMYQAARLAEADVIVRLTGDCPFIDPAMLDDNLRTFLNSEPPLDFAANRLPGTRTIPIGLDAEYFTMAAFERVWREADKPHQREHVCPYFYENPDRFRIQHIQHPSNTGQLRWTLDTPEDLTALRAIAAEFEDDTFTWQEVLALVQRKPEIQQINAAVAHKTQFDVDERQ